MDLDEAFLTSLVAEQSLEAAHGIIFAGITPETIKNPALQHVLKFYIEYVKDFKAVPSFDIIEGKTGVTLPRTPAGPLAFFQAEMQNRELHIGLAKLGEKLAVALEAREPHKAFETLLDGVRGLRSTGLASAKTVSLLSYGEAFLAHYDLIKSGWRGVETPWKSVNDATYGFWPEDLVLFAARLGVGKTWGLVAMINHAWAISKKKVLFLTTEMSQLRIFQRFASLHLKLPYDAVRKAQLPIFQEQRLREKIAELADMEGLYIAGGDFNFKIDAVEAAIQECEPDIVFVDGAYLLNAGGDSRFSNAAEVFDELKRQAKRTKLPIVVTSQLNRDAKAGKASSVDISKIAMTDVAGWNADLVYGMIQTEDMRKDRRMVLKPLKFREGTGEDVECWWDFDRMLFDEVGSVLVGPPAGSPEAGWKDDKPEVDDEYDTGLFAGGSADDDVPF